MKCKYCGKKGESELFTRSYPCGRRIKHITICFQCFWRATHEGLRQPKAAEADADCPLEDKAKQEDKPKRKHVRDDEEPMPRWKAALYDLQLEQRAEDKAKRKQGDYDWPSRDRA